MCKEKEVVKDGGRHLLKIIKSIIYNKEMEQTIKNR